MSGGPAYCFYAPMIVGDAGTAAALRGQPDVARALEQGSRVTKAVVGVGRWGAGASTVYDALVPAERDRLSELGVCAEVAGILLDAEGNLVPSPLAERTLTVAPERLEDIDEVLAVAYGVAKAHAVRAALRSGLVNGLVTHRGLALALL